MTKKTDDVKEQLKDIKSTSLPPFPLFTTFRELQFSEIRFTLRAKEIGRQLPKHAGKTEALPAQ